jgi:response regulator of citrate/malate metabolism
MIRVLVVDDDFMVARVHTGFVQRVPGFTVAGVAHSGRQALRAATELRPDLVLLDIHLPDIDGISVLKQLDEHCPDVDVLVITAAREVTTVRRALRGGVVHYLMKPFDYEDLRHRLEHYAAAHRRLANSETADQSEIDCIFGTGPILPKATPKGVSPETAAVVERTLRNSDEPLSASECAELVGISRVSARRYLEHFISTGQAQVALKYGYAGRPERRYQWQAR